MIYYPHSLHPRPLFITFSTVTKACKPAPLTFWLTALVLAATLMPSSGLAAEPPLSAAQIDWVAADQLTPEQAASLPPFCHGRYLDPPTSGNPADPEIYASADSAVYLFEQGSTLQGDVEISRGESVITAPFVSIDDASKVATIEGPLTIRRRGFLLTGTHATSNLMDDSGVVKNATFLLHQAYLRGAASELSQDASGVVRVTQGSLTRCEPGSNSWLVSGQGFVLDTQAGFGVARDVTLSVKNVPVLYLPWLRFPINDARQSGFLLANVGSSGSGGTDINIPYYFNLAPNRDATYQLRSLSHRGLIHDGQFRYLTPRTQNEINAGYISKDKIFDQRTLQADSDSLAFTAQNRWYLDLRHRGGLDSRWQTAINYSAVSDIDYLNDIGGEVGAAVSLLSSTPFDPGQTNRRSASLDQFAQALYRGQDWQATVTVRDFQLLDPFDPEQYAVLPKITLEHLARSGRWQLASRLEYAHFSKSTTQPLLNRNDPTDSNELLQITGERATAVLELSHAYRQPWGFLTPGLKLTHRQYQLDNTPEGYERKPALTTQTFYLDAGLLFNRAINLFSRPLEQTLEPRLFYLYTGEKDQSALPLFDVSSFTPGYAQLFRTNRFTGGDRAADANQLSLGLTTRLLNPRNGQQLLAASMGQIQYFKDRTVTLTDPGFDETTAARSPLFTEAMLNLNADLRVRAAFQWDPQSHQTHRRQIALNYATDTRKIFNLGYVYTNPQVEQRPGLAQEEASTSVIWPLSHQWSGIGAWNFDLDRRQTLETLFGIEYNDCCWKSRLMFRRFIKPTRFSLAAVGNSSTATELTTVGTIAANMDTGVFFEVQFKGLATLGRRLDSLLNDAIQGYRFSEDQIGY